MALRTIIRTGISLKISGPSMGILSLRKNLGSRWGYAAQSMRMSLSTVKGIFFSLHLHAGAEGDPTSEGVTDENHRRKPLFPDEGPHHDSLLFDGIGAVPGLGRQAEPLHVEEKDPKTVGREKRDDVMPGCV